MRHMLLLFAFLVFHGGSFSTPPDSAAITPKRIKRYHVNYWVTGSIIGVGMVSDYFAIGRLKNKPKITPEELVFLNSDQQKGVINSIDRWALQQNFENRDIFTKISDYGEIAIFLLPSLLMIDKNIRRDWFDLLLMYVEGHTITFSMYNYSPLGPTFVNRYRPFVYYSELTPDYRMNNNNSRNSFFSGHVGSCSYSTFFMAKVYCDYHPELGAKKYLIYLAASVPPLVIAYARVGALAHFPSDVAVGFAVGAIIGIVLPELHKTKLGKHLSLGMNESPEGTGITLRWKLQNQSILTSKN